jgi:acetolactate synthase regulatory subunit
MTNGEGGGAFPKRKTPRFRTGPSWLAGKGFQRLAAAPWLELKVENLKSNRRRAEGSRRCARRISREGLDFLFLVCSSEASLLAATIWLEVPMTVEKQREVIRLWNQLRKLEGPAAEELRIQILECFSEKDLSGKETVKRAA